MCPISRAWAKCLRQASKNGVCCARTVGLLCASIYYLCVSTECVGIFLYLHLAGVFYQ